MPRQLIRFPALVRAAIERHGGGWRGLRNATRRSVRVLRALGWRGLIDRIRASADRQALALPAPATLPLEPPTPLDRITLRVGVMAHVFYADLLDELRAHLAHMPLPFQLMVSVVDEQTRRAAIDRLQTLPNVHDLHVRIVPNRGRDLAPFFVTFREQILALDVVCHVHTKKSLHTGSEQGGWRRHLLESLLGSHRKIAAILGLFQAMPTLGLVYPECFTSVPLWAHTWLSNVPCARRLAPRLELAVETDAYLDFPIGCMFWARTAALRPLFDLQLTLENFPAESGQTDGTLQHTLERLLTQVTRRQGMLSCILPADGSLQLYAEGQRNWSSYFARSVARKIAYGAIDARVISVDVFDTLVTRPFLTPAGARAWMAQRVHAICGLENFARLRERAETAARAQAGHDVDIDAIYAAMARLPGVDDALALRLRDLEVDMERHLLRPREGVLDALAGARASDRRVIAVSDMYLGAERLRQVLPAAVSAALEHVYVSCDTHWRKDTAQAWQHLPQTEQVSPHQWLHIGDNEHADVQLPQSMGFIHPVHVLRPRALFDVVPALRGLRPAAQANTSWQDQLWLGLIANRFAELADRHPEAFGSTLTLDDPRMLGYTVFGPLVLDHVAWLARLALAEDMQSIVFLSREGFLLRRIYAVLRASTSALDAIEDHYLLASRRGIGTPSLRDADDLKNIFRGTYTGPLGDLLRARLGPRIAEAARAHLGESACAADVFLPDMCETIVDQLRPIAAAVLAIAAEERAPYLQYWNATVGTSRAMLADVGYAGTIQTHLARLTGRTLGGAYMATRRGIDQVRLHGGWARGRLHDQHEDTGAPPPVMRHDLLLEAVMTSPDGQFSHFDAGPDGPQAVHLGNGPSAIDWQVIERIHDGAEAFARDVCQVTGSDTINLAFDRRLIQEPLRCVGSGLWKPEAWAAALSVDDAYSGRGEVNTGDDQSADA